MWFENFDFIVETRQCDVIDKNLSYCTSIRNKVTRELFEAEFYNDTTCARIGHEKWIKIVLSKELPEMNELPILPRPIDEKIENLKISTVALIRILLTKTNYLTFVKVSKVPESNNLIVLAIGMDRVVYDIHKNEIVSMSSDIETLLDTYKTDAIMRQEGCFI